MKALGNMGVMTQEVQKTVIACAKNVKAPTSLRLAAIDASRRNPCQVNGNQAIFLRTRLIMLLKKKNRPGNTTWKS